MRDEGEPLQRLPLYPFMTLEIRDISKRFGTVQANAGVSLTVEPGSLHAVLGENGAGKSTLMKILSGYQDADTGEVLLDGSPIPLGRPRTAVEAGIGMLHQDPLVCLPFSALENYLFGRTGRIDRNRAREELTEGARRLGFQIDPDRPARGLSVGERQQLEIVRLLSLGVRVLILDEPTSGISTGQRTALFDALRTLADEGLIVLFVSHKLEEVEELCSRVTVMHKGSVVGERRLPCPTDELVSMMFGKPVELGRSTDTSGDEVTVAISGLSSVAGRRHVEDVDLDVHAGEVVGLAGLAGSGQRALLRTLAGLDHPLRGTISLGDTDITGLPHHQRRELGVHYLPAGRLEEGLFPGLTLTEHIALAHPTGRVVDWDATETETEEAIDEYQVVGAPSMPIEDLSGGNQQRMLLAMMPEHIRLLLLEEPTRGLDIDSANRIWERLLARAGEGTAIMVASADLDALVRYCHRIAVFFDGRIIDVVDAATADPLAIGSLIGGRRTA
jgi:ABC-type uncharacterized transport system ATPase subunit